MQLGYLDNHCGTGCLLLYIHAGLDEENKELQQKLAALKVESRQKEAVNQALAQEVAECRHKQQNEHHGESTGIFSSAGCLHTLVFVDTLVASVVCQAEKCSMWVCRVPVP